MKFLRYMMILVVACCATGFFIYRFGQVRGTHTTQVKGELMNIGEKRGWSFQRCDTSEWEVPNQHRWMRFIDRSTHNESLTQVEWEVDSAALTVNMYHREEDVHLLEVAPRWPGDVEAEFLLDVMKELFPDVPSYSPPR